MEQICSVLNGPEKCIRFARGEKRNDGARQRSDDRLIDTPGAVWYTITSAHLHIGHKRARIQERVQNDQRVLFRGQTITFRPPRKSTPPSI
jgi:hypothetical protein